MRQCQRRRFNRKRIAYEACIVLAKKKMVTELDEQKLVQQLKRIECFQGLIKQIDFMLEDDNPESGGSNDVKLQGDK